MRPRLLHTRGVLAAWMLVAGIGLAAPTAHAQSMRREEPHYIATLAGSRTVSPEGSRTTQPIGVGFSGGLEVPFKPNLAFTGWLGYDHFKLDQQALEDYFEDILDGPAPKTEGGGINVITIVVGPRVMWPLKPNLKPYLETVLGVAYVGAGDITINGQTYPLDISGGSAGQLVYAANLGCRFGVPGHFGWSIAIGWVSTRVDGQTLSYVPLRVSLISP